MHILMRWLQEVHQIRRSGLQGKADAAHTHMWIFPEQCQNLQEKISGAKGKAQTHEGNGSFEGQAINELSCPVQQAQCRTRCPARVCQRTKSKKNMDTKTVSIGKTTI